MKKLAIKLTLLLPLLLQIACSNQWRESNVDITEGEVNELLDEFSVSASSLSVNLNDLRSDEAASYYISRSGTDLMGDVISVFSFNSMGFLGYGVDQSIVDVDPAEVIALFVDGVGSDGQRYFSLLMKITEVDGSITYRSFSSTPDSAYFDDDYFEVELKGTTGTIVAYSYDLSDNFAEELASTIQLQIDEYSGGEYYHLGKIPIMQGYGGL